MLLRIFRANHFFNFILLPLTALLLLTGTFFYGDEIIHAGVVESPINIPFYSGAISLRLSVILNYVTLLIICFLLLQINAIFSFVRDRTFLPPFLFIFIVYSLPELHFFQPVFIAAIFILMAIRSLFHSFNHKSIIQSAFDGGFFIGMAGLFYMNANFLVLLVPLSLFILKNKLEWRGFVVPFIGLLLPWVFLFLYYYIWKDVGRLVLILNEAISPKESLAFVNNFQLIYFVYIALLIIVASLFILKRYGEKSISSRRYFKILSFFFGGSVLLLFLPSASIGLLVIITLPLTYLLSNYFISMRRQIWAELLFSFLVVLSIVLQFF